VWDVRIDTGITGPEATIFTTYLNGGGSLFLMGENIGFVARNNSIMNAAHPVAWQRGRLRTT